MGMKVFIVSDESHARHVFS